MLQLFLLILVHMKYCINETVWSFCFGVRDRAALRVLCTPYVLAGLCVWGEGVRCDSYWQCSYSSWTLLALWVRLIVFCCFFGMGKVARPVHTHFPTLMHTLILIHLYSFTDDGKSEFSFCFNRPVLTLPGLQYRYRRW